MLLINFCDDKEFSCRKMAFLERKHKFFSEIVLREMYSVYLFFGVAEDGIIERVKRPLRRNV